MANVKIETVYVLTLTEKEAELVKELAYARYDDDKDDSDTAEAVYDALNEVI
jgi:hypothetical protein